MIKVEEYFDNMVSEYSKAKNKLKHFVVVIKCSK